MRCFAVPLLLVLPLALAGGCTAPPPEARGPRAGLERMLAIDFGSSAMARRHAGWTRVRSGVAAELRRPSAWPRTLAGADDELQRLHTAKTDATSLLAAEAKRHPTVPATLQVAPNTWARDLAASLAALPAVLGLEHRPLREPGDREHRTDPNDDRPEATLWQRLARRLRL